MGQVTETGGIADTSIFIAKETGRRIDEKKAPAEMAVSVITIGELQAGVLRAADVVTRRRRQATLDSARGGDVLDVDETVAEVWAEMRAHLAATGRRVRINDLWIAATAAAHGLPVVAQDDDFDLVVGVRGLEVIQV